MSFTFVQLKENVVFQATLGFVFVWTSLLVNVAQLFTIPLRWIGLIDLQRYLLGKLTYIHWILVPAYAHWWANIDLRLYVKKQDLARLGNEKAVLLMNHKSQLDWITTWMLGEHFGVMQNIKAVAKKNLIFVPVVGPAFWLNEFIFIRRNFAEDKNILADSAVTYGSFKYNFWLLFFCEGTRFTPEKHKLSVEFAKNNGLQPLKHHLTPRTKGFISTIEGMRCSVPAIYDYTVCFGGGGDPTLKDYLQGKTIKADIFIKRIPMENVPNDHQECTEFIHQMYKDKDELCEYYQQHQMFPTNGELKESDDIVTVHISKHYRSLAFMIACTLSYLIPMGFLLSWILSSGSWLLCAATAGIVVAFTFLYQNMIGGGYAQSTYGKKMK